MGNKMSREACFSLSDLPADVFAKIINEDYTVLRTDGREEPGWKINTVPHSVGILCGGSYEGWHDGTGTRTVRGSDGLVVPRIMMNNGFCSKGKKFATFNEYCQYHVHESSSDEPKHTCGWRRFHKDYRGFWPTRLSSPEEKEDWFLWMDEQLASLKSPLEKEEKVKEKE